jgi:putative Mg2+ transporter-C (MgtC) family protein
VTTFHGIVTLRLVLAAVIGAAIGVERELRDQAAGLRTHMLVSVGACLFTLVSVYGFEAIASDQAPSARYDVTRVASNIVTGVGFLGAGAIIRHGLSIRGLTTAASLWIVAAMGTAVAVGMYWATVVAAVITIVSLWGLRTVRGRIRRAGGITREILTLRADSEAALDRALDLVQQRGYRIRHLRIEEGDGGIDGHVEMSPPGGARPEPLVAELTRVPGVTEVDWDRP